MGCYGIACTYYHDAPVYGLLAPSEETHDRSPVNPCTTIAEGDQVQERPTTARMGNHPNLSHRIAPCSPVEATGSPANICLRVLGWASESARPLRPSNGGNISPSLLRTFMAHIPHSHLHQVHSDRAREVPGAPCPMSRSFAISATQELATNRIYQVSPRGGHRQLTLEWTMEWNPNLLLTTYSPYTRL